MNTSEPITFVILGASGDLARRKVIPAFFALYCQTYYHRREIQQQGLGYLRNYHRNVDRRSTRH